MSQTTMLAVQSLLAFLQIVNAGLATQHVPPMVCLLVAAATGAAQTFLQNAGNKSLPQATQDQEKK